MKNIFQKKENNISATSKSIINMKTNINVNTRDLFYSKKDIGKEIVDEQSLFAKIFDKIISVSLFMIFFGIPLFFTGLTLQGIVFEKQIYFYAWILLALVAWVSKGVIIGEMKIRKTPLDIPILIFLIIYATSTFFSIDRWHSFWGFFGDPSRGLISLVAVIIAYYLIVSNYTAKRMHWMIGGLVVSSLMISTWSAFLFFSINIIPDKISQYIPLSFIGTITGLEVFVGMMIPIIMMASFKLTEYKNKLIKVIGYLLLIYIPINLALILAFYQRTVISIILLGVGFFLLYILSNIVSSRKKMVWVPMIAFVLTIVVLIIGNNKFAKINAPIEISPSAKISWKVATNSLKDNLLVGSGPAIYGFDFSKYKPEAFNDNIFYNLRFYQGTGLFFEALPTIGILGTIFLLALTITFINVAIYLISKERQKDKVYSLGLLSALIILIVSLFFVKLEGTILILTGILGALSIATMLYENNVEGNYINLSLKASPKFALTLAFIFIVVSAGVATLFVYIGKAYVADVYAGKNISNENTINEKSINNILRAISLNKREGRYYSRASQEFMILANKNATNSEKNKNTKKIKKYLDKASLYANKGAEYMPNDALTIAALAQINESLTMYDQKALKLALKNYEDLQKLEPNSPIPFLKIGQIKMVISMSEKDKAKKKKLLEDANDNLQKAIAKKKNFAEGYFYLALAKNALKDKDGAISAMTEAVKIDQNNINYLANLGRLYQDRDKKGDLDNAQKIFKYIISVNPKDIDANFTLALLYEKKGEKENAIKQYNETIKLITESKSKNRDNIIKQIRKMIENVKNGINNNTISNINSNKKNNNVVNKKKQNDETMSEKTVRTDEQKPAVSNNEESNTTQPK